MISLWCMVLLSASLCICDTRVKYAAVIYRHGDRTPVDMYPTDPWRNQSIWPVKFGELTNIGKRQHYALGGWLRKRYSHLLSDKFDPEEIYVRSTDVDRTLMSAQANLAGMYPPVNESIWNPSLLWQPIPVHTVPELDDKLLAMKKPCATYSLELRTLVHSKQYKERLSKYQKLMDYLSQHTGKKVKDYYDIDSIYSNLHIESFYNLTLPEWTHSVFPDQLVEPAAYSFKVNTMTPSLARFKIGPLLHEILLHMKNVINEDTFGGKHKNLKVSIFSGHDFTIGCVLNGLGMYDNKLPDYTSTVIIELVSDDVTHMNYVRISYRNTPEIVEPNVLEIPNCGQLCPVDKFAKLYADLINVDWERECNKQFPAVLGMSFVVGLALFATIYVSHKFYFARISKQQQLNIAYTSIHATTPSSVKVVEL